jgi:hypothetical protein
LVKLFFDYFFELVSAINYLADMGMCAAELKVSNLYRFFHNMRARCWPKVAAGKEFASV